MRSSIQSSITHLTKLMIHEQKADVHLTGTTHQIIKLWLPVQHTQPIFQGHRIDTEITVSGCTENQQYHIQEPRDTEQQSKINRNADASLSAGNT